jgi:hypothetical protein
VTWGAVLAGPVCALAGAGLRLLAGASRAREHRELVVDLAAVLPAGGRLVYQAGGNVRVTLVTAPGRDV